MVKMFELLGPPAPITSATAERISLRVIRHYLWGLNSHPLVLHSLLLWDTKQYRLLFHFPVLPASSVKGGLNLTDQCLLCRHRFLGNQVVKISRAVGKGLSLYPNSFLHGDKQV